MVVCPTYFTFYNFFMFIHVILKTKPFCLPKSETGEWEAPLTVGKM